MPRVLRNYEHEDFSYLLEEFNSNKPDPTELHPEEFTLRIERDTRNWYSHFLKESQKVLRITKGRDFIIYFELVYYMIRLSIIDRLGIPASEENIKEFYYTVHDWILAIVYDKDNPIKSNTYRIVQSWNEFREFIEKLQVGYEAGQEKEKQD